VAVVTGAITVAYTAGIGKASGVPADALAYGLGVVAAAALIARRSQPLLVLGVVVAAHIVFHGLGYAGPGPFSATLVALYTLAGAGLRTIAFVAAAGLSVAATLFQIVSGDGTALEPSVIMPLLLSFGVVLLGDAVHSRRAYFSEVQERLKRAESERELEAERRVTHERLRIARELHDVIAHTLAVVTVQANVANDLFDEKPEEAKAALQAIRRASREALSELKTTIGVLRDPTSSHPESPSVPRAPAPGLGQVDDLVDLATGSGIEVRLETEGEVRRLPAAVDLTAYRIIQESLTNVLRHAHAARAQVRVCYRPDGVEIEVRDDGRGPGGSAARGHGIVGMKERASILGGRLETGPSPDGGFSVFAHLPTGGVER
jgi:signal transduction histidine kinase